MLPVVVVGYVVLIFVAILLGVVSGAVARLILRLPFERLWIDALLGLAGLVIVSVWRGFADDVIALFDLGRHIRGRVDQYVVAMAMVAMVLPALGQLLRFMVRKADRK